MSSDPTIDLTLVPEVQARAALKGRRVRFVMLAPVGGWLGVGTLRVVRATERDDAIELVCGYERYERSAA